MLLQKNVQLSTWSFQILLLWMYYTWALFLSLPCFTCLRFSTQGTYIWMCFFFLIMLSFQLVGLSVVFYSSVGLSVNWLPLTALGLNVLASSLPYRCMSCVPSSWKSQIYIWFSTNLPFFSFSSSSSSSFSLLPVAAAERLYSQLERNRLLSNELKLTLHDLCDWWQGSLMPIKPSLLLTTDLDPSKKLIVISKFIKLP